MIMAFLTSLSKYWHLWVIAILITGYGIMIGVIENKNISIKFCELKLEHQKIQIESIKQQSMIENEKVKNAAMEALKEVAESKKAAYLILNENVPKDCLSAIKWSIRQASNF